MFSSKKYVLAVFVASFVLVASVNCAPENVNAESLQARLRRSAQFPDIPNIPSIPSGIPGAGMIKNAGGFAKNIPGADNIPGLPRSKRSISAAENMELMAMRNKREARGTGNLPTKTG